VTAIPNCVGPLCGQGTGQITPLGPYIHPNPWTQTPPPWQKCPAVQIASTGTHYCPQCRKAARLEAVIVTKRELPDGSEVAERTARALICGEHGVLAWLDRPST
jgi:hypothetical protein